MMDEPEILPAPPARSQLRLGNLRPFERDPDIIQAGMLCDRCSKVAVGWVNTCTVTCETCIDLFLIAAMVDG